MTKLFIASFCVCVYEYPVYLHISLWIVICICLLIFIYITLRLNVRLTILNQLYDLVDGFMSLKYTEMFVRCIYQLVTIIMLFFLVMKETPKRWSWRHVLRMFLCFRSWHSCMPMLTVAWNACLNNTCGFIFVWTLEIWDGKSNNKLH